MVVDDDQDIRESLQAILENQQYTAITAANKAEGMEKIKTERPDLIILDLMMTTWQDGFEMARELKKDPQFRAFHEGESQVLPEFYHRLYENLLGPYATLLSDEDRQPVHQRSSVLPSS